MDFYLVAILGCVLSFLGVYFLMPPYIKALKEHNINQSVSEYALEEYKTKQNKIYDNKTMLANLSWTLDMLMTR